MQYLYTLAFRVFRRYFQYASQYEDDLTQEAVIKGYQLLIEGNYDDYWGPPYNYVFTGMRNAMSNYLKKHREIQLAEGQDEIVVQRDDTVDFEAWEEIFQDKDPITIRSNVLNFMEGPQVLNLWDMTPEEKQIFVQIVSKRTKFSEAHNLFERNGDLILFLLFLFAGERMTFPPETNLEKFARHSRVYLLIEGGMSFEDVAHKVDLRVQHVKRIYESVKSLMNGVEIDAERTESGPERLEEENAGSPPENGRPSLVL